MQYTVKEELLDYASFVNFIKSEVKERMGQGYTIKIIKVMKNNSLKQDSLVVQKEEENYAPFVFLEGYYDSYISGTPLTDIIDRICRTYKDCAIPFMREDFENTLEHMQSYIFFRLINFERNEKLLAQIPYVKFLDLAITFHCMVHNDENSIRTIRITNEHVEKWQTTCSELLKLAFSNTRRLFPPVVRTMEESVRELVSDDNVYNEMINDWQYRGRNSMYILSNEKGIHGASSLLYMDVIREFAELLNSDLFILPSSIHEIILMPVKNPNDKEKLQRMVKEVNDILVPLEEVLSDNVYIYSLEMDHIVL